VLALFEQMKRDGVVPVSATYAAVLRACNVAGSVSTALKVLQEMISWELSVQGQSEGAGVYVGGLNWAACLLCRSRYYSVLLDTLAQLHRDKVPLRASTFNLVLGSLAEEGKWGEVLRVVDRMKAYGVLPDEQSYSCSITAHVALGNMAGATKLLTDMSDQGLAVRPESVKMWVSMTNGRLWPGVGGRNGYLGGVGAPLLPSGVQ